MKNNKKSLSILNIIIGLFLIISIILTACGPRQGDGENTPIATLLSIGKKLSPNETTEETYVFSGTVGVIENTTYGNTTVTDSTGSIYIYGIRDLLGKRYDEMATPPDEGDNVQLRGAVTRYVSESGKESIQVKNAKLLFISKKVVERPSVLPKCENHNDKNGDDICESCNRKISVTIDFFAINDLHGKFKDTDTQPGVDELSSYLEKQQNSGNAVLLSIGDMWQGSSESNLTKGALITEWMNHLDFASMTLGNHEFDWGTQYIADNQKIAQFPFLAINVYDRKTNQRVAYCQPSTTLTVDGVKIGIIGAIGDCYSSISADKTGDVYFKVGSELTSLVKAESQKLREQGVEFIVYTLHDGYENSKSKVTSLSAKEISYFYDVSLSSGGYVDLVFEAHTHQRYVYTDPYGVYHIQAGGENTAISNVEISFNTGSGQAEVNLAKYLYNSSYSNYQSHPVVEQLLEKYADQIALGDKALGYNKYFRTSDYLGDLCAQLYTQVGVAQWGDDYDIVLGGGFIKTRSPYDLDPGNITYSTIQSLFPFDNQIVLCKVNGSTLFDIFMSGQNNYHVDYTQYGQEVQSNFSRSATYYVVTDSYTSSYYPDRITVVERYDNTVFARDLIADFIEAGGLA